MPNPFGGPPVEDVWKDVWGAGPYGYLLGPNKFNPKSFGDWLENLPESENVEDRRDPNYRPPDRGYTISQSIGEWPEYKELEPPKEPTYKEPEVPSKSNKGKVPKTQKEWDEFNRFMEVMAAYGRR
jgi:hypothetical protein